MAAQGNLKSAAITNLDLTPPVRATAGQEGGGTIVTYANDSAAVDSYSDATEPPEHFM